MRPGRTSWVLLIPLLIFQFSLTGKSLAACDVFPVLVEACDNGAGWGFVNLTEYDEAINGNTGNAVFWWQDENATSPVPDPTNAEIWGGSLWVTVTDGSCTSDPTLIQTVVIPSMPLNDFTIIECLEGQPSAILDLTGYENIVPGLPGFPVQWYTDPDLANPISNPAAFPITGDQVIYAIVPDTCLLDTAQITIIAESQVDPAQVTFELSNDGICGSGLVNITITLPGGGTGGVELELYNLAGNLVSTVSTGFSSGIPWTFGISETTVVQVASMTPGLQCPIFFTPPTIDTVSLIQQPDAFPASLHACAGPNGQGTFDLFSVNQVVNGGTGLPVLYYTDLSLGNEITDPGNYTAFPSTVYAVVQGGNGCNSDPVPVTLSVIPAPFAINQAFHGCDDGTGQALFDLTSIESAVQGGTQNTVIWYADPDLTNPITDPGAFLSTTVDVYAVVDNGTCLSNVATINLFVDPLPTVDNTFLEVNPDQACGQTLIGIQFFVPGDGNYEITFSYGNPGSGYSTFTTSVSNFSIVQLVISEPTEFFITSVQGETNCIVNFSLPDTVVANITQTPDLVLDGPPPVYCVGDQVDLSTLPIVDLNNTGIPIQFYSALPALPGNQIDPPIITAAQGQTVYAVADGGAGCFDELAIPIVIEDAPVGVSIPMFGCDQGDGTAIFDLTQNEDLIGFASFLPILWYQDPGLTQPILDPANYQSPTGMVYAVVDGPGCDSEPIEIPLTVEPTPTVDNAFITVDDGAVCGDGNYIVTFFLPGSDAYTVTMDYGNVTDGFQEYIGVNVFDGSQVPFVLQGDATFILTSVTVQSNGACAVVFDPPVEINVSGDNGPNLILTGQPEICQGENIDLSLFVSDQNNVDVPITFHGMFPATPQNQVDPLVNPGATTTYYAYAETPNGCTSTIPVQVIVNEPATPVIPNQQICEGDGLFDLSDIEDPGFPGGDWSGPGVSGNTFNPAGLDGVVELIYEPIEPCTVPTTVQIQIEDQQTPQLGTLTICSIGEPFDLAALEDPLYPGGTWSGQGVDGQLFDPSGLTGEITLFFESDQSCTAPAQTVVTVLPDVSYSLGALSLCADNAPVNLQQLLDNQGLTGTWTGPGVTGNQFDPQGLEGLVEVSFEPDFCAEIGTAIITVHSIPQIESTEQDCAAENDFYTVTVSFSGLGYNGLTANGEVISSTPFISPEITSGTPFLISFSDTAGCWSDVVEGVVDCGCISDAGSMVFPSEPLAVCVGGSFQVSGDNNLVMENDDLVRFILHDQSGILLGTIISVSEDGEFSDIQGVVPGVIYYVSRVVGSDDGSGIIDPDDPCLSVAPGVPVVFYVPEVSFSGPDLLCDDCGTYTFEFSGEPPFAIWVRFDIPGGNLSFQDTVDTDQWEVEFCPSDWSIEQDSFIVEVIQFEDGQCNADLADVQVLTVYVSGLVTDLLTPRICPGDSVQVDGLWYSAGNSTGMDTILNPAGCDTVRIVEVEFLEQPEYLLDQAICPGDTVRVNGTAYHEENPVGVEVLPGAASNGCDSVVLVNLSIAAEIMDTVLFSACVGDTITVDGLLLDEDKPSGTAILPNMQGNGCDTIRHFLVDFNESSISNFTVTICPGDSIVFGGIVFNEENPSGSVLLEGAAATGCDSLVLVSLDIAAEIKDTVLLSTCAGDTITVDGLLLDEDKPSGTAILPNVQGNGCDTMRHFIVAFNDPSISNFTSTICPGDSLVVGGMVFNEETPSGTILLEGAALNGCDSVVLVELAVDPVKFGMRDYLICAGDSVKVEGEWFGGNRPAGEITLEGAGENGCDSILLVSVGFLPPAVGQVQLEACAGDTVSVAGISFTGDVQDSTIVLPGGSTAGCDSIILANVVFFPTYETLISDTLPLDSSIVINGELFDQDRSFDVLELQSSQGCDSTLVVDLTFLDEPEDPQGVIFSVSNPLCAGDSGIWTFSSLPGWDGVSPVWVSLDGQDPFRVGTLPFSIANLDEGNYALFITDSSGFAVDTFFSVQPGFSFDIGIAAASNLFQGSPVSLQAEGVPPGSSVRWMTLGELVCEDCPSTELLFLESSSFVYLEVLSPQGCSALDSVFIIVEESPDMPVLFIPNVFTPDQDGQNDVFQVFHNESYELISIEIYDRWGQLVFEFNESSAQPPFWDGQFNGVDVLPGVYVYRCILQEASGNTIRRFGDVTLLR